MLSNISHSPASTTRSSLDSSDRIELHNVAMTSPHARSLQAKSFGRQRVAQVCPFAALRQGLDVGLHAPTTTVIDIVLTLTFARSGRQSADIRKSQQQAHLVSHLYGTLACRAEGPLVPAISGVTRQN